MKEGGEFPGGGSRQVLAVTAVARVLLEEEFAGKVVSIGGGSEVVGGDGRWDDFGSGFNGGAAASGSLQACHGDEREK